MNPWGCRREWSARQAGKWARGAEAATPKDPLRQDQITQPIRECLLPALLLRAQDLEDQDDADALRDDPVMQLSVSTR